jgi:hypothetical protein
MTSNPIRDVRLRLVDEGHSTRPPLLEWIPAVPALGTGRPARPQASPRLGCGAGADRPGSGDVAPLAGDPLDDRVGGVAVQLPEDAGVAVAGQGRVEWPSCSSTTLMSTPASRAMVTAPCPTSCSRIGGRPAPAMRRRKMQQPGHQRPERRVEVSSATSADGRAQASGTDIMANANTQSRRTRARRPGTRPRGGNRSAARRPCSSSRRHTADRGWRIPAAGRRLGGGDAGSGGPGAGIYRAGTWFRRTTRRAAAQSLAGFDASAGDADADVVGASRGPDVLVVACGEVVQCTGTDPVRAGCRRPRVP